MLQCWVSEGEFYIGGFVLLTFNEPVRCAILSLCRTHFRSPNAVAFSSNNNNNKKKKKKKKKKNDI